MLPEIIQNPTMSDVAGIWKTSGRMGHDRSVRFIKSPEGVVYAFDGSDCTHDQVIKSLGGEGTWGRGENIEIRRRMPRGGEWEFGQNHHS